MEAIVTEKPRAEILRKLWQPNWEKSKPEKSYDLYRDGRRIQAIGAGKPWPVPQYPSWQENPFENPSWRNSYHSLTWLWAPLHGFEAHGDTTCRDDVLSYVRQWVKAHPTTDDKVAWYDHSVAFRTAMLVYVFHAFGDSDLSETDKTDIVESLRIHARLLDGFLGKIRNNHSFFHALSLYNLAQAFPDWDHASAWRETARNSLRLSFESMVDIDEGVTREQSIGYHWGAVNLILTAHQLCYAFNDPLHGEAEDLAILQKMMRFGELMTLPGDFTAPIGDTEHPLPHQKSRIAKRYRDRVSSLIHSPMEEPTKDGADVHIFPRTGYAIYRPEKPAGFQLIFRFGPQKWSHGHSDGLSVILSACGGRLLTDSGGPYIYDRSNPGRQYAIHARAHNTVVVDGQDHTLGDCTLLAHAQTPQYFFIQASHRNYPGVTHLRSVIALETGAVVILDDLTAADDVERRYDLLYHFPPETRIDAHTDDYEVIAPQNGSARLAVCGGRVLSYACVEGQELPQWQGWVFPKSGRIPAPVSIFTQQCTNAWFGTIVRPFRKAIKPLRLNLQRGEDGAWRIEVPANGGNWILEMPRQGAAPIVLQSPSSTIVPD